jgi:hypothetical protein
MKTSVPSCAIGLAVVVVAVVIQVSAQTPARVPAGKAPSAGALALDRGNAPAGLPEERADTEMIFRWLEPFAWLLTPPQMDGLRVSIREHLPEMRTLEDRRFMLRAELFLASIRTNGSAGSPKEKSQALGQVEAELAARRAAILKGIQPPLNLEQRDQIRGVLLRLFERGLEPFSFVRTDESARSALQRLEEEMRGATPLSPVPFSPPTRPVTIAPPTRTAPVAPGT